MRQLVIIMGLVSFAYLSLVSVGYAECVADINCDGVVDGTDLADFADSYGNANCNNCINDPNLLPENIKSGVSIFGVYGELHGGCTCKGTLNGTRWCDNGDGTVIDLSTCLVWLKNANCHGHNYFLSAMDYAAVDTHSGWCSLKDGSRKLEWRLPTSFELDSLANGTEAVRSDNMRAFVNVQPGYYWSGSLHFKFSGGFVPNGVTDAVDMSTGDRDELIVSKYPDGFAVDVRCYIWPVRGPN